MKPSTPQTKQPKRRSGSASVTVKVKKNNETFYVAFTDKQVAIVYSMLYEYLQEIVKKDLLK